MLNLFFTLARFSKKLFFDFSHFSAPEMLEVHIDNLLDIKKRTNTSKNGGDVILTGIHPCSAVLGGNKLAYQYED